MADRYERALAAAVRPRRALVVAIGLAGALLVGLGLPASGARLAELAARPGMDRLVAGGGLTAEGRERLVEGVGRALDWLAEPRLEKELALVLQALAAREPGPASTGLLVEARRRLAGALEQAPADPAGWLRLAQLDAALLDLAGAARALRASAMAGLIAREAVVARAALAMGLWEWLAEPLRTAAARELAPAFRADPAAVAGVASRTGRTAELRASLAADRAALAALEAELARLGQAASSRAEPTG